MCKHPQSIQLECAVTGKTSMLRCRDVNEDGSCRFYRKERVEQRAQKKPKKPRHRKSKSVSGEGESGGEE